MTQIPSYLDPEIAPTPNYPLIHPPGAIIGPLHQNILSRRTLSLDLLFGWNRQRHYDVKSDVSRTRQPVIISITSRTKTVNALQKSKLRKYVHIWSHRVLLGKSTILQLFPCYSVCLSSQCDIFPTLPKRKNKERYLNGRYKTCHLSLKGKENFKLTVEFSGSN